MGTPGQPSDRTRPRARRDAAWHPSANREDVRAYMQQRLALLSKLMFWIFWVLVAFLLGLYEVYPSTRSPRADVVHQAAIAGLIVLAAIWYFWLHKGRVSLAGLYRIDALYMLVVGLLFGMSAYFQSDQRAAVYSALIWHTFMVFMRTNIVPSSARRTAVVSALSFVPMLIGGAATSAFDPQRLEVPPLAFMVGALLFCGVATVLAATGSGVIYGLRKQVSAARQLGQYTLDEKIGEGGMGAVYRARHAMLRRPTAIKLLPPSRFGAEALRRFEREVQHMAELTHPNTVAVFDYGRSPDGVFYYAMEYLDGIDLESLVRRDGPQAAPRVIRILRQVCGALDEAHARGLTHRDIKPANVILCQRGRTPDVAKVVDFGLVKEITRSLDDTASKVIAGTPAYLAPEAVTDPDRVGPRSDLYAVGCVGYFLLTGHRVFDGRTAVDVCVHHARTPPTPPSARTALPIPAGLEAVILRCLAKDPDDRPASAEALRDLLGALPEASAWDEAAARAWWAEFEVRRSTATPEDATAPDGPLTITVDVDGRTVPPPSDEFFAD